MCVGGGGVCVCVDVRVYVYGRGWLVWWRSGI